MGLGRAHCAKGRDLIELLDEEWGFDWKKRRACGASLARGGAKIDSGAGLGGKMVFPAKFKEKSGI